MPYLRNVAAYEIAAVSETGDRAQRHLFAAAGDHHWRMRVSHRFRLEDRVLDMEIPTVEGRPRLSPHLQDQLDPFLHLSDARRRLRRELPAVLLVFLLEETGPDPERQSPPADQIDACRDLGQLCWIALPPSRCTRLPSDSGNYGSDP